MFQVSLREPFVEFATQQAAARGFTDAGAYVEHLIEADRRAALRARVEQSLAEGLESEAIEVTPEWWAAKRELISKTAGESAA